MAVADQFDSLESREGQPEVRHGVVPAVDPEKIKSDKKASGGSSGLQSSRSGSGGNGPAETAAAIKAGVADPWTGNAYPDDEGRDKNADYQGLPVGETVRDGAQVLAEQEKQESER